MVVHLSFPAPTGAPLSSTDTREGIAGLTVRDLAGNVRAGILPNTTAALVTARASMGVDVAGFGAVLNRSGALLIANDGAVTVPLGAAPSSNSRIDVVYVKQNESAAPFSDADNTPVLGVTAGTASVTPTAPNVPAGALPLAQVLIPSTASTTQSAGVVITQVYPYTAANGGTVLVRNQAERDAQSWPDGTRVWRIDTNAVEVRSSGSWLVYDSAPQTYTPALSGPTTIGVGTGGSLVGEYTRIGNLVHVRVAIIFGTGLNITAGSVRVSLPFAAAAKANGQRVQGQYYYPPIGTITAMLYVPAAGASTGTIVVPTNATSNAQADLDMGTAAGAGNPAVSGAYGIADNSNLLFEGTYYM